METAAGLKQDWVEQQVNYDSTIMGSENILKKKTF